jgi:hypothetical protein
MALPAFVSTHKGDALRATFWLVEIGLSTPLYLTTCDQPIAYDSHTYAPAVMSIDGYQTDADSGGVNGGKLVLASGGSYWQALLEEIAGGARDFAVTLSEAWLDVEDFPSPVAAAVRVVAKTRVEAAEWDAETLVFSLGPSADPSLGRLPFREYGAGECTYRRFKGGQCGYAGAATECDRTLATCTGFGNQARFGGLNPDRREEFTATWQWISGDVDYTASVTFRRREA